MKGRGLEDVLVMMQKISARGKHPPEIMRAMQISGDDSVLGELQIADVIVSAEDAQLDPISLAALADASQPDQRNVEVIQEYARRARTDKPRTVTLPDGGSERVVRDHAPHVLREAREEAILSRAKSQVLAGSADPPGIDVDDQVPHRYLDAAHTVSANAGPEVGPEAGDQFRHAERFRYVVVRAGLQTGDDIGLVAKRRQNDDRHTRNVPYLPAESQTGLVA